MFLEKAVLKIRTKFSGEHPRWSVISIKSLYNFIKIILWHGCSPVNLLHIFRTPFTKNTSRLLLLKVVNQQNDVMKYSSYRPVVKIKNSNTVIQQKIALCLVNTFQVGLFSRKVLFRRKSKLLDMFFKFKLPISNFDRIFSVDSFATHVYF